MPLEIRFNPGHSWGRRRSARRLAVLNLVLWTALSGWSLTSSQVLSQVPEPGAGLPVQSPVPEADAGLPVQSPVPEADAGVPADQEPSEDYARLLDMAENSWLYGDYAEVIRILGTSLFPEPSDALSERQLIQSFVLVGSSYYFLNQNNAAEQGFHELLRIEPDYMLDPLLYPSAVINFLDEVRARYGDELDSIRLARGQQTGPQEGQLLYVERRVTERSWWVSALPFGIGHFSNDQDGWGWAYLVTELVLAGTSMSMALAFESSRDADGFFRDADQARTLQVIQLATGYSFFAILAVNVVHGLMIHEGVIETSYRTLGPPSAPLEPESQVRPFVTLAGESTWPVLGFRGSW